MFFKSQTYWKVRHWEHEMIFWTMLTNACSDKRSLVTNCWVIKTDSSGRRNENSVIRPVRHKDWHSLVGDASRLLLSVHFPSIGVVEKFLLVYKNLTTTANVYSKPSFSAKWSEYSEHFNSVQCERKMDNNLPVNIKFLFHCYFINWEKSCTSLQELITFIADTDSCIDYPILMHCGVEKGASWVIICPLFNPKMQQKDQSMQKSVSAINLKMPSAQLG